MFIKELNCLFLQLRNWKHVHGHVLISALFCLVYPQSLWLATWTCRPNGVLLQVRQHGFFQVFLHLKETSPPTSGKPNSRAGKTKNSMVGVVSANTQMVGVVQVFRGKMNDDSAHGKSWYGSVSACFRFLSSWRLEKYVNFIPPKKQPKPINKQTNWKERVEDVWFISSPPPHPKKTNTTFKR